MCSAISLKVSNVEIDPCENVKYLGVQIDSQLIFNLHIRLMENKLSRSIGIIIKLKSFLSPTALLKLYYAIVHPHLLYGLLVWGTTSTSYSAKLYTLQNKVVQHQRWAVPNYFCTELQNRITFFVPVPVPTGTFENSTGTGTDLLVLLQNRYFFRYF